MTVAFSVAALPTYAVATAPALGGTAAAGTLVAAYGIAILLGSAGLMVRPLRRDADRPVSCLAALVAATLILVMHAAASAPDARQKRCKTTPNGSAIHTIMLWIAGLLGSEFAGLVAD